MANTYGDLQSAIIRDLRNRTDLATIVPEEIAQRITFFQDEPFSQQEATDTSIITTSGTATYDLATTVARVTGAWYLYAGTVWVPLYARSIEWLNTADAIVPPVTSPPSIYAVYGRQFRVYPWPNNAWQVKLQVIARTAVPGSSGAANLWTQDAYALIRHATVEVLSAQYLHDQALAVQAGALKQRELDFLLTRATILSATGQIQPRWY